MNKVATAAEQTIPDNKVHNRKQDCDPEILRPLQIRKEAVMRGSGDHTKEITKIITKHTGRRLRTKKSVKGFKVNKWDLIKHIRKLYTPKYTKMRNLDGNLVDDRERAETLAKHFEQRQWHKTRQPPPEHNTYSIEQPTRN